MFDKVNIISGTCNSGKTSFAHLVSRIIGGNIYYCITNKYDEDNRFRDISTKNIGFKDLCYLEPSTIIVDIDNNFKINIDMVRNANHHTYIITNQVIFNGTSIKSRERYINNLSNIKYFKTQDMVLKCLYSGVEYGINELQCLIERDYKISKILE